MHTPDFVTPIFTDNMNEIAMYRRSRNWMWTLNPEVVVLGKLASNLLFLLTHPHMLKYGAWVYVAHMAWLVGGVCVCVFCMYPSHTIL